MYNGSTPVPNRLSDRTSGARATLMRVGLASTLVCALGTTGAIAQGTQASRTQQLQTQGLRQTPGRLIIPITGTIASPAGSPGPAEPSTPSTPPTPPDSTTLPPETPTPETTPTVPAASDVFGTFSIQRFARTTDGEVAAVGTLTVSLVDPASTQTRTIITQVAMPVARSGGAAAPSSSSIGFSQTSVTQSAVSPVASQGTRPGPDQACETLNLTLEGIELDLLGIPVQLDPVNVDFTVVPGTGSRLSGLLCGVNGALDSGASPVERTNMLNSLLDTIG